MLRLLVAAQIVRIGVFGLFHPTEVVIRPVPGGALAVEMGAERFALQDGESLRLRAAGDRVTARGRAGAIRVHAAPRGGGDFILSVPRRIERRFRGELDTTAAAGALTVVVSMDLETAVASVAAAESPSGAPLAALEAQAVTTRSYYAAMRGRHNGFDFCDTTHCQFLREPPASRTLAAAAARRTRGLILSYHDAPVAGLFSASCGGSTRPFPDPPPGAYPYFAVKCPFCRDGVRRGHGYGLCQTGAKGMAESGASYRDILSRHFPGTELVTLRY